MAKLAPFFSITFTCLFLVVRLAHGDMISSCDQTPYPGVCNSMITKSPLSSLDHDVTQFGFRHLALMSTMDQARNAHWLMSNIDPVSFDERGKRAWADCVELFDDSINHLNRSLSSTDPASFEDAQTWLSAAVTNQVTCTNGFMELNSSSHLDSFPSMWGNFSKFLGNSLAINKAAAANLSTKSGGGRRLLSSGFPRWITAADRKLLQSSSAASNADVVVAKDGSGNYNTISEAVAAAAAAGNRSGNTRFVVHVKAGVYSENVEIKNTMKNLMFIGDGIDATIVTGSRNVQDGDTTFRSATFGVSGDGFIARDMTFQNTAGPQKQQAVAFRLGSDLSVMYRCSFKGYQDTLYVYSQRQFYRECDIYGTVDFIFGDAVAVLQNCNIYVRKPMSGQENSVTAQGRSDPNENTGISIHGSRVTAALDLQPVQGSFRTYLGRPWKKYSRTVFMKTYLDSLIDPQGWEEWTGSFALSTLYYGEYMNTGGGAGTSGRVNWPGFHVITSAAEAGKFSAGSFLGGNSWIPATGVPYTSGL